jgi:lipoprotein-releasing system permease protein
VYQALLTRRYLTSKVMPLLAAVAVTLCVAMELIVWSVMGGFLVMLVESGRTLVGDVSINYSSVGFGHYDDLVKRLEADPMVEAAAPVIESYGLVSLPLGGAPRTIVVKGIDDRFDTVTEYGASLWWKPVDQPLPKDKGREDLRLDSEIRERLAEYYRQGLTLTAPGADPIAKNKDGVTIGGKAAMVTGVELGGYNERLPSGVLRPARVIGEAMPVILDPNRTAILTVLPQDMRGRPIEPVAVPLPVVNQFRSGIYEIDARTVFVRLDLLQRMLKMQAAPRTGAPKLVIGDDNVEHFEVGPATSMEPARVTTVLVRAKPGVVYDDLRERCREIFAQFKAAHESDRAVPPAEAMDVQTWRDQNRMLIEAVEKETGLVLFIFGIISLTSVFLVLAIFWAMVSEKTKDIGVLRAIGASRAGVAWIWLRYGLAIGVAGGLVGGGLAWLIVTNINPIHEWLGQTFGLVIWDPRVYYFSVIPNRIEPSKAAIVMVSGVVASVLGALIPALKAANMDPVKALRFE